MKKIKVYLIVTSLLLLVTLGLLLYVWFTIQFFHTKAKEVERDAYAPHAAEVPDSKNAP